jgi:hypothetical protein
VLVKLNSTTNTKLKDSPTQKGMKQMEIKTIFMIVVWKKGYLNEGHLGLKN